MLRSELKTTDYAPYYGVYYELLSGETNLHQALDKGETQFKSLLDKIPDSKLQFAYAEGKWTIAEVLLHILDTERIFQYRALRFARKDATPVPGFEQDDYVLAANTSNRTKESILTEYIAIRSSTIALFNSFDKETLLLAGTASGARMSVGAVGFLLSAHQLHHSKIIEERYL